MRLPEARGDEIHGKEGRGGATSRRMRGRTWTGPSGLVRQGKSHLHLQSPPKNSKSLKQRHLSVHGHQQPHAWWYLALLTKLGDWPLNVGA